MARAAELVLKSDCKTETGKFYLDDELLIANDGETNETLNKKYNVDPKKNHTELMPDLML